jgi:aryl-alcohol dehydrogenase-like predicted oxidoreductase
VNPVQFLLVVQADVWPAANNRQRRKSMQHMLHLAEREIRPLGVGVWSWGDRTFWGYGKTYNQQDVTEAFTTSIELGITLFDTAEVYGGGESERILGSLIRKHQAPAVVASKFAPLFWRFTAGSVPRALQGSLRRLGLPRIDLYQVHWPYTFISNTALMNALADAVEAGKIGAVGVSNYSSKQMRRAHEALARRGIALAANQVNYSLLKRTPEINGVLDTCRELGVVLIAYSPLAQGMLTGKYTADNPPGGPRRFSMSRSRLRAIEPVTDLLRSIGQEHGGKTPAQVALAWLIAQGGVLPIPGAKNARQARDNAGALGWELSTAQQEALEQATRDWRK